MDHGTSAYFRISTVKQLRLERPKLKVATNVFVEAIATVIDILIDNRIVILIDGPKNFYAFYEEKTDPELRTFENEIDQEPRTAKGAIDQELRTAKNEIDPELRTAETFMIENLLQKFGFTVQRLDPKLLEQQISTITNNLLSK